MGRAWILDTSTKGTGANMVPLENTLRTRSERAEPIHVPPRKSPKLAPPPAARGPRSFKIVDILTRQVLTQDATAKEAVEVLRDVRSIVDVSIYVWERNTEKWRLLSFDERRALWVHRDAPPASDSGRAQVASTPDGLDSLGALAR